MGFLASGTPLEWEEAKHWADHIRDHGMTQFIHVWQRLKDRTGDELLWGDEVHFVSLSSSDPAYTTLMKLEYMVVVFDDAEKNAKLSLRQTEILARLNSVVDSISSDCPCQ